MMTSHAASARQPARVLPAIAEQHTLAQSILLHLLPGVLIAVVFFASAPLARQWQLPPFMAQCFADLVVLVPSVLGFLYYQGYRRNGRFSLDGVVLYRERLPWWQFAGLVPHFLCAVPSVVALAGDRTGAERLALGRGGAMEAEHLSGHGGAYHRKQY